MRIVLDTNIIISGLFWQGHSRRILYDGLKGKYLLCFSQETIEELKTVLSYPKFVPKIKKLNFTIEDFLSTLTDSSLMVVLSGKVNIIKEHPADNVFLSCALSCGAHFIISGDQHLLKLKKFQKIFIVTAKQFLARKK